MVILLELASICYLWFRSYDIAVVGYLTKVGQNYLVGWNDLDGSLNYRFHLTLSEALDFAQNALGLAEGRGTDSRMELENVWIHDRYGSFVLLWKPARTAFLNQLTFQSEQEVRYFADAFRRGAYSTSPFGHAVLLLPVRGTL